jgi:hypothetical protein
MALGWAGYLPHVRSARQVFADDLVAMSLAEQTVQRDTKALAEGCKGKGNKGRRKGKGLIQRPRVKLG